MNQHDVEKRTEQYWDGAITALDIALIYLQRDAIDAWKRSWVKWLAVRLAAKLLLWANR